MRTSIKYVYKYALLACAFKTNDCTLSRHVYLMKKAIRFLRALPQIEAAIRFLDILE